MILKKQILSILLLCSVTGFTQNQDELDLKQADEYFAASNYVQSLELYEKLAPKFPLKTELKRKMATCYLGINDLHAKALKNLLEIYSNGNYDDKLLLELGKACQFNYKFDSAIVFYNKYREKIPAAQQRVIDLYVVNCENAKELIKKPVNVRFDNLGPEINSKYPDYNPFVTKDQSALYFTTRREECTGNLRTLSGYFASDIFVSKVKKGVWQKARNLQEPLNTFQDEELTGIGNDGKTIVVYTGNMQYGGDLLFSDFVKPKGFGKPISFKVPVNAGNGLEKQGCFSSDGNTLYFVSYRPGGKGEADIYFTRRLPNGEWGIPVNAGPNINTAYNEGYPMISDDGKTLSFTSQGHTSMGGYDIFRSTWDEKKKQWGEAVNVGYPVNTPEDDMMFSLAGNNRDGYMSACRKGGYGDLDIYKVTFLDAEKPLTAIVGTVRSADSTQSLVDVNITLLDAKTNAVIESKPVNKKTGRYIFIVEPGDYRAEIKGKYFQVLKEDISVLDKSDFTVELEKNFVISPQK